MQKIMHATEVGSSLTYEKGHKGKAVYKTLDRGQYAIEANDIIMENAKTGKKIELGNCKPISSKKLFAANMTLPQTELLQTFPGLIQKFFTNRGLSGDKDAWMVNYSIAK
jgi:ribosomal protein S17